VSFCSNDDVHLCYNDGKRDKRGSERDDNTYVGVATSERILVPVGRGEDGQEWEELNKGNI
jgi:hypothetical protein